MELKESACVHEFSFNGFTAYFLLLILVGFVTTRKVNSEMFFTANRNSPWYLVASDDRDNAFRGDFYLDPRGGR